MMTNTVPRGTDYHYLTMEDARAKRLILISYLVLLCAAILDLAAEPAWRLLEKKMPLAFVAGNVDTTVRSIRTAPNDMHSTNDIPMESVVKEASISIGGYKTITYRHTSTSGGLVESKYEVTDNFLGLAGFDFDHTSQNRTVDEAGATLALSRDVQVNALVLTPYKLLFSGIALITLMFYRKDMRMYFYDHFRYQSSTYRHYIGLIILTGMLCGFLSGFITVLIPGYALWI